MYLLLIDQCDPSFKNKLKTTKGYYKAHNAQDGIKLLYLIMSVPCGMEAHLKVKWSIIKAEKCLYTFFQSRNTTNYDYTK